MPRSTVARLFAARGIVLFMAGCAMQRVADTPRFEVAPFWPKPLPNNLILGQVAGVAVDERDHLWIIQRPRSLSADERGAALRRVTRGNGDRHTSRATVHLLLKGFSRRSQNVRPSVSSV